MFSGCGGRLTTDNRQLTTDMNTIDKGHIGENIAGDFLHDNGFDILHRNWHCRWGEIDIIAQSPDGAIVFVEVKSARSNKFGDPVEWVTRRKVEKIVKSANQFLLDNDIDDVPLRFDIITVDLRTREVTHYPDAFMVERD